jgi:hypothetical protein
LLESKKNEIEREINERKFPFAGNDDFSPSIFIGFPHFSSNNH